MIQLDGVTKQYQSGGQMVEALRAFSGKVEAGEFVVITGRSGAGKSTLLSLIGGLIRPDAGRIQVAGQDLWAMDDARRSQFRCRTMGFIFQFASLIPTLTVVENVLLPTAFLTDSTGANRTRAQALLERVGLGGMAERMPWQLSGGQQKRVAVARALLHQPRLLLADEPTADLDEQTEQEIASLLVELNKAGTTVLLSTHNTDLTALATRRLVLTQGQVSLVS